MNNAIEDSFYVIKCNITGEIPSFPSFITYAVIFRQILIMVRMAVVRIVMMVMTTANLDFLLLSVMMFSIFMTFHHYHNSSQVPLWGPFPLSFSEPKAQPCLQRKPHDPGLANESNSSPSHNDWLGKEE